MIALEFGFRPNLTLQEEINRARLVIWKLNWLSALKRTQSTYRLTVQ